MKKILCIMMMFLALGGALYSEQIFEVDTKYGVKTVVVPDGYSTEEVLCQVAKAYYELDEDYDTLTIQYEDLAEEVKEYIKDNEELRFSYDTLQKQYQSLVSLQNKDSLMDNFRLYLSMNSSLNRGSPSMGVNGGTVLFDKLMLGGGLRFTPTESSPLQIVAEIGFLF